MLTVHLAEYLVVSQILLARVARGARNFVTRNFSTGTHEGPKREEPRENQPGEPRMRIKREEFAR